MSHCKRVWWKLMYWRLLLLEAYTLSVRNCPRVRWKVVMIAIVPHDQGLVGLSFASQCGSLYEIDVVVRLEGCGVGRLWRVRWLCWSALWSLEKWRCEIYIRIHPLQKGVLMNIISVAEWWSIMGRCIRVRSGWPHYVKLHKSKVHVMMSLAHPFVRDIFYFISRCM